MVSNATESCQVIFSSECKPANADTERDNAKAAEDPPTSNGDSECCQMLQQTLAIGCPLPSTLEVIVPLHPAASECAPAMDLHPSAHQQWTYMFCDRERETKSSRGPELPPTSEADHIAKATSIYMADPVQQLDPNSTQLNIVTP